MFYIPINNMFAITQRVNVLQTTVAALQNKVYSLNNKVENADTNTLSSSSSPIVDNKVDDVAKSVQKMQVDLATKHVESKKEIEKILSKQEELKKELKLIETTLTMKTEQLVNKLVRERLEVMGADLKRSLEVAHDTSAPVSRDGKDEDYEIDVMLANEVASTATEDVTKPKKRGRKPIVKTA